LLQSKANRQKSCYKVRIHTDETDATERGLALNRLKRIQFI